MAASVDERSASRDVQMLQKVKELETEIKELKENNEFLTTERAVLAESLREAEENLLKESGKKKDVDELKSLSQNLYEKVKEMSKKINLLEKELSIKNELLEKLGEKYYRNRKVWEENEAKATSEIKKLDDVIDNIICTLKKVPQEVIDSCEQLKQLFQVLEVEQESMGNKKYFCGGKLNA